MALAAGIPKSRIVTFERCQKINGDVGGREFASSFGIFEKEKPAFALVRVYPRHGEPKTLAAAAFWSDHGAVLLGLPPLECNGKHEQKYIVASVEGRNFLFSMPVEKAHTDLIWTLRGMVGNDAGMEGGGFLSIWNNTTPDLSGKSGTFNVNDVTTEARNALSPFLRFWDDFTIFRKEAGFLQ